MALSRRRFLGLTLTGAAGVLVPACSPSEREGGAPGSAVRPSALGTPSQLAATPNLVDSSAPAVQVTWGAVADAQSYDVELNGIVVARSNTTTQFDIAKGDGRTGLTGGDNSVRVRGRAGELEGPWSDVQTFTVRPAGVVRSRGFDAEDDGPIALTTGDGEPAAGGGTALLVGAPFALGGQGKGLSLTCTNPADTKAYKNHDILPVEECWVRLSFSPRAASVDGTRVQLARINDSVGEASERLLWVTGQAITSSSVKVEVPVPNEAWVQLQLGVDADGRVELWAFDGTRETLVGTGRSSLVGRTKNRVSIGNHHPSLGITFEAWIDDVAVGESRLPWLRTNDARPLARPRSLDVEQLPAKFSFVFGSCTNSNHVPANGSALSAAADVDADFMIHLGDFGYLDSAAYSQSVNGYLASWGDLLAGAAMSRLSERPWIFTCSDHDLGGNNIVAATAAPFAADAFARFNANDSTVEPDGRYGSVTMDDGRVLLIWTEGVLYRSSLDDPSAPGNTKLGTEQKAWLLDLLESTDAKLIVIATETTFAHESNTSWSNHPQERSEVLAAVAASPAQVRFLSGDLHRARWARLAPNVVEWGAAAMAEFPEGPPAPLPDVEDSALADFAGYRSRPSALDAMTVEEFNSTTTFGYAEIDTNSHSARFELRASDNTVRIDERGQPMAEELTYD